MQAPTRVIGQHRAQAGFPSGRPGEQIAEAEPGLGRADDAAAKILDGHDRYLRPLDGFAIAQSAEPRGRTHG